MQATRLQLLLGRYAIYKENQRSRREDEKKSELHKLKEVVHKTSSVLKHAKGVFPFDLFPDIIQIDRQKLTIINRQFFGIHKSVSVPIADIKNVQVEVGPILGSLTVTSEHFINNTAVVSYLWRKDALELQRLIQGMMIANKRKIDLSKIKRKELPRLLEQLGESG